MPSWNFGEGLGSATKWTGTRDPSAFLAVPATLEFLDEWRSDSNSGDGGGLCAHEYNRSELLRHIEALSTAWSREPFALQPKSTVGCLGMVQLPEALDVADVPGVPGEGLRATLRERYPQDCD